MAKLLSMRLMIALVFALLATVACDLIGRALPPVSESGELVVITRNSATTYFEDAAGDYAGLEHDLVAMMADEMKVRVKFLVVDSLADIPGMLDEGRAHMAAAGLVRTLDWQKKVQFGPVYQEVQAQVVYNLNGERPRAIADLVGKRVEVLAGSNLVEVLVEAQKELPQLAWTEVSDRQPDALLERLAEGETDYVLVNSHLAAVAQNYHPDLGVAFSLGKPENLAWAFPVKGDAELIRKAKTFFDRIAKDGTLKSLIDRYYGHVERLQRIDVVTFLASMNTLLPDLRSHFEQGQILTGIDWRLLAAMGYQESHWDPLATSPTGVRGLMMLTGDTADRLGVTDRLDPRQSILGGSRYLRTLKESLPDRVAEPDRTWMAIAAYNIGFGHLEDGRILAQRMKLNPDAWVDLKKVLPLLAKAEHHATVKHGFARGGEAVIMVENVRTYHDILVKYQKPYRTPFPTLGSDDWLLP